MITTHPAPFPGRLRDGTPDLSTPAGRAHAFGERIKTLAGAESRGGYGMKSLNAALEKMRGTPSDAKLLSLIGDVPVKTVHDRHGNLSCPEKRRELFNSRITMLMSKKPDGGEGMSFKEAIEEMKSNPIDAPLLRAMGAQCNTK